MSEFDWVKARSACSLAGIYEKLKMDLQEDVKTRQSLRGENDTYYGVKIVAKDKRTAVVVEGNGIYDSVLFILTDDGIDIADKDGKVRFKATPTLSDDGECRLKVGDQERELWHVRKMALEELFFRRY
jgi:hypothetical protein